ncbi:L-threonylcarbamoyladenylate synthase [Schleiferiaceae bacterium]|jgi:L-threonylcarbamoyladenylate synthase|nr:threonylcarbamoyl-AMP synthase [Flavobacteriales bacterium]MDC1022306.1 L-threonylcarbamoyladenylate synthase [Schleiferiaceae bacterium]|tara:strand:+ start:2079 stop:3023 length:945 start_codon:yes stop_codon:yes gene_type:complete
MAVISDSNEAVRLLKNGGIVALPTETVYGLGANALDEHAVAKVFKVKNRPSFDPLIVHVASIEQAKLIAEVTDEAEALFRRFSPGPLTLILQKKQIVPDLTTSGHMTVGVRIPNHPIVLEVIRNSGLCIAAPSANPFGYTSPTNAAHVFDQFGDGIDAVLDGGPCEVGIESTILEMSETPKILRLGGLSIESIEDVIGKVIIESSSSDPKAPGMLSSHYNPGVNVRLFESLNEMLSQYKVVNKSSIGLLIMGKGPCGDNMYNLSTSNDDVEAASRLFTGLHQLKAKGFREIWAHSVPENGLGRAINDRLKRAAH